MNQNEILAFGILGFYGVMMSVAVAWQIKQIKELNGQVDAQWTAMQHLSNRVKGLEMRRPGADGAE